MPSIIIEEFFQRTTELTSHFLGTSLPIHSITHTLWTGCKLKNSVKDHHMIGKPAGFRGVDQHNQLEVFFPRSVPRYLYLLDLA